MSTNVSTVTAHFPDAENGFTTTTAGSVASGATTVTLNSVAGYTNGQPAVFVIDPTDPAKKQTFTGIVDTTGVQVTNVKWTAGTNQTHALGATVVDYATATHIAMMSKGILVEHNQDGTHAAVTATSMSTTGNASFGGTLGVTGALTLKSYDGWITETRTWTYASGSGTNVGTFTVAGVDLTSVYNVGDRVKFTQTTVKYGIITKVAFSTDTTVTIYMGTDYTIANAAITSPAYSHDRSPAGFPMDPAKWTITTNSINNCVKSSPTNGTWYGDTGLSSTGPNITLPIGAWSVTYHAVSYITAEATSPLAVKMTLSTSSTTESDGRFTTYQSFNSAASPGRFSVPVTRSGYITTTSSTLYYLNISAATTGINAIQISGSTGAQTTITAVCAYL